MSRECCTDPACSCNQPPVWTSAACFAGKHENCKGERTRLKTERDRAESGGGWVFEKCACGCHAKETAGIDMKEAFAR